MKMSIHNPLLTLHLLTQQRIFIVGSKTETFVEFATAIPELGRLATVCDSDTDCRNDHTSDSEHALDADTLSQ